MALNHPVLESVAFPEKVCCSSMMTKTNPSLTLTPLQGFPDIHEKDALDQIILHVLAQQNLQLDTGDVLVIAQKIVSKSEGCYVDYSKLVPSERAYDLGNICGKDPQLVQLILNESNEVLRVSAGVLVVEHRSGFVSANAGVDHSNIDHKAKDHEKWALLIPEDADQSAEQLRISIKKNTGKDVGILIIDSHGRAWRNGTVGVTIGLSGLDALIDKRGQYDLYGNQLQATIIAAVDELAAGASLVMGQADEGTPVVLVKGYPYKPGNGKLKDLIRKRENDLFR
jgi:coenzyme F420-0:L-glutamate ligase / coenzyme F420-1:gamma-L-glutamate ligase